MLRRHGRGVAEPGSACRQRNTAAPRTCMPSVPRAARASANVLGSQCCLQEVLPSALPRARRTADLRFEYAAPPAGAQHMMRWRPCMAVGMHSSSFRRRHNANAAPPGAGTRHAPNRTPRNPPTSTGGRMPLRLPHTPEAQGPKVTTKPPASAQEIVCLSAAAARISCWGPVAARPSGRQARTASCCCPRQRRCCRCCCCPPRTAPMSHHPKSTGNRCRR